MIFEKHAANPILPLPGTAALDFAECSFIGADGSSTRRTMTEEQDKAIRDYLAETYSLDSIWYADPFLILQSDDLPPENERPFTIGGLIDIWQTSEEASFIPLIGEPGMGDALHPEAVHEAIFADTNDNEVLPEDIIIFLASHVFMDCTGITCLWTGLVIELPESDDIAGFRERAYDLPRNIAGIPMNIYYHNGPPPPSERRRAELNDPTALKNAFMEMDCSPKVLLRSGDQNYGDTYLVDGSTSKQRLCGLGQRFTIERKLGQHPHLADTTKDENEFPLDDVAYIALRQGVYFTNTPMMKIRDSICGSVLLRCKERGPKNDISHRGEICGMIQYPYADLQSRYTSTAERYIVYADPFDELIKDWGSIVQHAEPQSAITEGPGTRARGIDDLDDESEESPTKKRRIVS